MKKVVGAIAIMSAVVFGGFVYYQLTHDTEVRGPDTWQAAISKPIIKEEPEGQMSDNKEKAMSINKLLPDLDSLKGLEKESDDLLEGMDGILNVNTEDPLKDAVQ